MISCSTRSFCSGWFTMSEEFGTEVPPGATIVHEPHGFVRLVTYNATDLMVVNAARVSFRKRSDWAAELEDGTGGILEEADEKVLRFLLKNKHGTPFEHTHFLFHIRAPIFVFREWHRHRIGVSINEESARYVPLKPDFYFPDNAHCRRQVGKPGHYTFEQMKPDTAERVVRRSMGRAYFVAYATYEDLLANGVAKEIARAVLPVGIYSQMYWTCNARSLMNFLGLRNAPTALMEIRDYAQAMESIFAEKMPVTCSAFVDNGRVAP